MVQHNRAHDDPTFERKFTALDDGTEEGVGTIRGAAEEPSADQITQHTGVLPVCRRTALYAKYPRVDGRREDRDQTMQHTGVLPEYLRIDGRRGDQGSSFSQDTGSRIMQKVRVRAGRAAVRVSPRLYGNGLTPITTRASSVRETR